MVVPTWPVDQPRMKLPHDDGCDIFRASGGSSRADEPSVPGIDGTMRARRSVIMSSVVAGLCLKRKTSTTRPEMVIT